MRQGTKLKKTRANKGFTHKIIPFERDVNYYIQKGNQHFLKNNWPKALLFYKKTIEMAPDDPFNHYNFGCLLSKMGQLEEANKVFEFILENIDENYWDCYFLLAINYGLLEDIERAQSYLQYYLNNSPDGEMAEEAQELLWSLDEEMLDELDFFDDYDDIFFNESKEEIIADIKNLHRDEFIKKYESDSFFWYALRRILYQGNDSLKEDIINIYGHIANKEAEDTLKEFVRNPWVKDRLKQMALLTYKNLGYEDKCQVYLKGKFQEVNLSKYPLKAPFWEEEWQKVLVCTLKSMRRSKEYGENFFEDVQAMWIDFINKVYPNVPGFRNPKTWAAGLEYSLTRFHFLNVTQKNIARKYEVSESSVGAKFKAINDILKIDQKAYKNMLAYLFQTEKDD